MVDVYDPSTPLVIELDRSGKQATIPMRIHRIGSQRVWIPKSIKSIGAALDDLGLPKKDARDLHEYITFHTAEGDTEGSFHSSALGTDPDDRPDATWRVARVGDDRSVVLSVIHSEAEGDGREAKVLNAMDAARADGVSPTEFFVALASLIRDGSVTVVEDADLDDGYVQQWLILTRRGASKLEG